MFLKYKGSEAMPHKHNDEKIALLKCLNNRQRCGRRLLNEDNWIF